ncbi:trehalase-like protein [Pseudomassariella vexata]|uniref:Trehalase n=1 Tax=Pseudomassariella vexata TaxID=1141098 RepID=A0A1Y2DSX8_9PEZI|nr:trehalase-like protein [Pseudomassariella vexata]ORY62246.1 trehalase-like protein [Pseudomassariella vexata]
MAGLRGLVVAALLLSPPFVNGLYANGSVVAPCDSPLYCQGEILKAIELAKPYSDSKTFVDLPTIRPMDEVIAAFDELSKPLSNNTELNTFLSTYFGEAGSELTAVRTDELTTDPVFLDKVDDTVIKQFVQKVINIWPDLTREYVSAGKCTGCVDSFIPVNRTFVVAGGRFREPYYWDSFWIIEGLLRTGGSFTEIAKNIVENFLDSVDKFGFVPNGFRIYYLNRSQPPLLTQMVKIYVEYTNDTSILERAVPLLIKEHDFWMQNRTVDIESGDEIYTLNRYGVQNTEPRPESYREDYISANNESYYSTSGIIYPEVNGLTDEEKATLYANLASGAESGWDYSSRWLANPNDAADDVYFPLRSLNTVNTIGVDLNSILYANEISIARFLAASGDDTGAQQFSELAEQRAAAIQSLMWNETHMSYFDYNLTSNSQNLYVPMDDDTTPAQRGDAPEGYQVMFHVGQFYPFWLGVAPKSIRNNPLAVKIAFQRVADLLAQKAGAIAATNFQTGQQWDQPNVWPPLMYVLMKALLETPATFGEDDVYYIETQDLALRLGQRYLDSTFCTWRATGGSTDDMSQLEGLESTDEGIMFEKYGDNSTNAVGGGGEYEVVEGFGWTNGVLLWVADTFNTQLQRPDCGNITAAVNTEKRGAGPSAVELDQSDARNVKLFHKQPA